MEDLAQYKNRVNILKDKLSKENKNFINKISENNYGTKVFDDFSVEINKSDIDWINENNIPKIHGSINPFEFEKEYYQGYDDSDEDYEECNSNVHCTECIDGIKGNCYTYNQFLKEEAERMKKK